MIVAKENIYYENRMFKPKEPLPCYDIKMVKAWLASGVAIDTDKGVVKSTPVVSTNKQKKEDEQDKTTKKEDQGETTKEINVKEKKSVKNIITKVKTRSRK